MINVNSYKLIIVIYLSHYLLLLMLEFLPAWLAMLPYGLDSNVTQLLPNILTKPSVFYYSPIIPCNLVSIKLLLLLLLLNMDEITLIHTGLAWKVSNFSFCYFWQFKNSLYNKYSNTWHGLNFHCKGNFFKCS